MRAALGTFGQALRTAAQGRPAPIEFLCPAGIPLARMDAASWAGGPRPGDEWLLRECGGPTLDVGCGPGRLLRALARRGVPALGIDISAEAVTQARRHGVHALLLDVFDPVPGEGTWENVVLADGNVGIGGDPARLLRRAAELSTRDGRIAVELGAPGSGSWRRLVRLRHADSHSPAFWWAAVAADQIEAPAAEARLRVARRWSEAGRWFALLAKEVR
jgi:SAM-dependent methyltransferase